jgi:hypothetical protein
MHLSLFFYLGEISSDNIDHFLQPISPLFLSAGGHNGKILAEKYFHTADSKDTIFPNVLQGVTI